MFGLESGQAGYNTEDISSGVGEVWRIDLPDGRSVVRKNYGWSDDEDEDWDPEHEEEYAVDQARAEVVAARVAEVIGALVPPVIRAPGSQTVVWMGHVDGELGWTWKPAQPGSIILPDLEDLDVTTSAGRDAWRLGLLDLLIGNNDRHGGNWFHTEDGRIFGIDHGQAGVLVGDGLRLPSEPVEMLVPSPFAQLFYGEHLVRLAPSPLHPDDIRELIGRLRNLRREGVLRQHELDYMFWVLDLLRPHAKGDRRLIP